MDSIKKKNYSNDAFKNKQVNSILHFEMLTLYMYLVK